MAFQVAIWSDPTSCVRTTNIDSWIWNTEPDVISRLQMIMKRLSTEIQD